MIENDMLSQVIDPAQKEVIAEVQKLVEEKGIKEKVMKEAQQLAQKQAIHLMDPSSEEAPVFKGINLEEEDPDEYFLVLEYLESIGLKFTPTVLKYESQNPDVECNRAKLASKLKLRNYDRTPLLVQIIEERLKSLENK